MTASRRLVAVRPRPLASFLAIASLAGLGIVVPVVTALAEPPGPPPYRATLGGPGHAELYPSGLEVGDDGLVVADTGNDRVRKYGPDGALRWEVGDTGAGVNQFDNPRDVGVDSAGNVYVADTGNVRIVKLAGDGTWQSSWKGPSTDRLGVPMGLTVTNDVVYVADGRKKKVRMYGTDGTQIRAFGQEGDCSFSMIRDVDADSAGNVYVANYSYHNILKMTDAGTCLGKWGTKGTGELQFRNPYGVRVAFDPVLLQEAVYVADSNNNRVQELTTDGRFVAQLGSFGDIDKPGTFAGLRRVAVASDGDVWGADLWGWRVERFDRGEDGYAYAETIGAVRPPLSDGAVFNQVRGISFDPDGTVHAVDTVNQRIVRMTPSGQILNACGKRGWQSGAFNWPAGVAVDPATNNIWVADTKQSRLQVIRPDCKAVAIVGRYGSALGQLNWPYSIAIRPGDRIAWVADTVNHRVVSYDVETRTPIAAFGSRGSGTDKLNNPRGIAIDPATGHVLVADTRNNRIVELSDAGGANITVVRILTGGFRAPEGVAVDASGRIFVADTGDSEVVMLSPDGLETWLLSGPDQLNRPTNVAVDNTGRVLVADTLNDRIQVFAHAHS